MLTERIIRDAKGDGKARTIWDSQVKGLGLQITQGGKRNFVIRYKVGDRRRQAIIARAGQITLKEARERAGRELAAIRAGETDPLRRREQSMQAPTVNDGLDRFFGEFVPRRIADGRMTERTRRDYRAQAERTIPAGARHSQDRRRDSPRYRARRRQARPGAAQPDAGAAIAAVQSVRGVGVPAAAHQPRPRY